MTAPLYPAIDSGYTPSLYAYTYLLSPAKTWAQFGELEVVVKTPYYMTESGIDGFTRTDGGYALSLPGLPEGELKKVIWPTKKQMVNNTTVALVVMLISAICIWGFDQIAQMGVKALITLVG